MKKKNKIILGVILLLILITGVTYAILTWTSGKINLGLTSGCFTIDYTKGSDIANASIKIINEGDLISDNKFTIKEGVALTYANIGIKSSCTIEGYGSLYLNVTSLSSAFTTGSSKGSLKYAVLNNTSTTSTITVAGLLNQSFDIVAKGSITSTGTITLLTKQLSNTSLNKYLIVVYIDDNMAYNDAIGATFNATVSADANQGKMAEPLSTTITNLYNNATKKDVVNNNVTYKYDTTHSLMKDVGGNIRYYGATPNNYIYFNCTDYSNQSSSTCETWRIIGIFDNKLKIIRNNPIGTLPYDNDSEDVHLQSINYSNNEITASLLAVAPSQGSGQSDYSKSSLQKILNNYYYNSLKYNGNSSYDFTNIGMKNDTTRNMIAEVNYSLLGWDSSSVYSAQIYNYERATGSVYTGYASVWTGKIALPYLSDFGYSVDLNKCNKMLLEYSIEVDLCISNNWMMALPISSSVNQWLLTSSLKKNSVWCANSNGSFSNTDNVANSGEVLPVLFLNSNITIDSTTDGSSANPYKIII